MKTISTLKALFAFFASIFLLQAITIAQPDYSFTSFSHVSGTDKQVGALYRFTNVKSGLDALVTITAITGGVSINNLDGGSGYSEAFQPVVTAPSGANGYIEFNIQFVTAGTSTPVVQTTVAATPIDVDGDNNVKEFDQIQRISGVVDYNVTGLELSIGYASGWFTGTNIGAVDYPGIDTSAKGVMFTVINTNISSFRIRTGVNNQGNSNVNRLRSVYFRRFIYPVSALLPLSHLISFTGAASQNKVSLNWELAAGHSFSKVIVERSENGTTYIAVNETAVASADKNTKASYTDFKVNDGNVYYRLKMITVAGKTEYSNVLVFKSGNNNSTKQIKVYPTAIQSSVAVNVTAENSGSAVFQIADYSGRIVYQQAINLQTGNNNIAIQGLDKLMKGNYIALVKQGNSVHQQKVVKL
jgi:hypothetical protein